MPAGKPPLIVIAGPQLRVAYGVNVSMSSCLQRSLATDRAADSKSRAAQPSSLRQLQAALVQGEICEPALACSIAPNHIARAWQDVEQRTAGPY